MLYSINFDRIRERNAINSDDFKGIYFNDISVKSEGYQKFINYTTTMKMMVKILSMIKKPMTPAVVYMQLLRIPLWIKMPRS